MREIHMIGIVGIIVYTKQTINRSFGKPKNLFSLQVW
jgi:hypothetical protein